MEEINGVLSAQSFESLLQWLYAGQVTFAAASSPTQQISAMIAFSRLADMYDVSGTEDLVAKQIKEVIVAGRLFSKEPVGANTRWITPEQIYSATCLPKGHPVRGVLAAASVEEYLLCDTYKFFNVAQTNLEYATDFLNQLWTTLRGIKNRTDVIDPINGHKLNRSQYVGDSWDAD